MRPCRHSHWQRRSAGNRPYGVHTVRVFVCRGLPVDAWQGQVSLQAHGMGRRIAASIYAVQGVHARVLGERRGFVRRRDTGDMVLLGVQRYVLHERSYGTSALAYRVVSLADGPVPERTGRSAGPCGAQRTLYDVRGVYRHGSYGQGQGGQPAVFRVPAHGRVLRPVLRLQCFRDSAHHAFLCSGTERERQAVPCGGPVVVRRLHAWVGFASGIHRRVGWFHAGAGIRQVEGHMPEVVRQHVLLVLSGTHAGLVVSVLCGVAVTVFPC